jgi:midasin
MHSLVQPYATAKFPLRLPPRCLKIFAILLYNRFFPSTLPFRLAARQGSAKASECRIGSHTMESIAVYCSWADAQLQQEHAFLQDLPLELRTLIVQSPTPQYLDYITDLSRDSRYTGALFSLYRPLFPEIVARWMKTSYTGSLLEAITTLSCLARLLPFATYLRPHIQALLRDDPLGTYVRIDGASSATSAGEDVQILLLAIFRILSVDRDMLHDSVGPLFLSKFLRHHSPPVRYLAIQCLCITMHFADAYSQKLVSIYIGKDAILGGWEGMTIDFRVLKLLEEEQWAAFAKNIALVDDWWKSPPTVATSRSFSDHDLLPSTVSIGGVLHYGSAAIASQGTGNESQFVVTPTSEQNLRQLGTSLLSDKSILIAGPPSSGKTSIVEEAARLLGKRSSMITLHLNEQTDAKSLLGIHTSSANGQSFSWQPGVLTKAMQQGRWVLIEDIDRAPSEVMGVLRPILENGELFLPSRKQIVRPLDGFRILATTRTSERDASNSTGRHSWLLNPRLWSKVNCNIYSLDEYEALLRLRFPSIIVFLPMLLRLHEDLLRFYSDQKPLRALQTRMPSLRELLKLARRTSTRLREYQPLSASTPLPEQLKFDIFKDSIDCYAASLHVTEVFELVASSMATSLDISPQQMKFCLDQSSENVAELNGAYRFGRTSLQRSSGRRHKNIKSPFALTTTVSRTLESIAATAHGHEPCLLVGETGVGKTTLIQHIAHAVGQTLTVLNLSQQSEVGDLLGGLKPVTTRSLVMPTLDKFNVLFDDTFSAKKNEKFQMALTKAITKQNWPRLIILWIEAIELARHFLKSTDDDAQDKTVHVTKKRKLDGAKYVNLRKRWGDFEQSFQQIRTSVERAEKGHAFAFVEGKLVQAVRNGEWVLLDEINLAPSETLDHILSLLSNGDASRPSLLLAEAGNIEIIQAHPDFRLFAAMNPATDAGKKDLPLGLRSRFTEIYVSSGDDNAEDLIKIIQTYLGAQLDLDRKAASDLANAYLSLKNLNARHQLTDGAGETPHFSIRSLVRCLMYASQHGSTQGLRRAMYEGFAMSFFTSLSRASESLSLPQVEKHLLSNVKSRKSFFSQQHKIPQNSDDFVSFRHHLVKRGLEQPKSQSHYIRTASVERNLLNLARAASMQRFPVLLQGPTSAGKTSMVEHLAKLSGNKFVRINNHEHTDLQEYLGSYASDNDGKLAFREGVLVEALRLGHWIVLDELNLAPSDVLEALNRLLDDNRELLIPESQEIVRPHPNFMLFATQNPAGLYGGRKRLSRAFRNRFLEIHFDDIPEDELEVILRERTQRAPSFCNKIVAVYKSLSRQRQSSRLFEHRNSFATLRDLFRWASRPVHTWEELGYHGFMLLAERVRDPSERAIVKQTIEKEIGVKLDEDVLYGASQIPTEVQEQEVVVWTPAMRRVFVLVREALKNHEPVLLVGETGCGKTQICQVMARAFGRPLNVYNAHTNTETGDLIGSQRPIRNRSDLANAVRAAWQALCLNGGLDIESADVDVESIIQRVPTMDLGQYDAIATTRLKASIGAYQALFAWNDGSLVKAMRNGQHFLLDEISLAEDSVLERLNSVLEPSRTILLAEKGTTENLVIATPDFQFLATMNPGGDYGKRELSAALRNRVTEIWVPLLSKEADLQPIVESKLPIDKQSFVSPMLEFASWFQGEFHGAAAKGAALRDLLAWADFITRSVAVSPELGFIHGAFMIYVDSIGANPAGMISSSTANLAVSRSSCIAHLQKFVSLDVSAQYRETPTLTSATDSFRVGLFALPRTSSVSAGVPDLIFDAPTTLRNTMKVVRALQMMRPILLEGSPGVGKTAIVMALGQACGRRLTRINLSDQTDLMDLFGADAPVEGTQIGQFLWQDGPLLEAMQRGDWVLLDEMNLASQSVLEGLNSCLDHRREVYIAELDKSFQCHPDFTLFAAQNPHHQGGGRKGLPASFVNRFTVVYADPFEQEDLQHICKARYPAVYECQLQPVIKIISQLDRLVRAPAFAQGGPWEVNLRDVNRWLKLCLEQSSLPSSHHVRTIVTQRFRTPAQKQLLSVVLDEVFGPRQQESMYNNLNLSEYQVETRLLRRDSTVAHQAAHKTLATQQLPAANAIMTSISHAWPVILAGPSGSGKSMLLRQLAAIAGAELVEVSMNADVDVIDLVGGLEQHDLHRDVAEFRDALQIILRLRLAECFAAAADGSDPGQLIALWHYWDTNTPDTSDVEHVLKNTVALLPETEAAAAKLLSSAQSANETSLRFVWQDGILVDVVEKGSWLVLDNANLCNPSVLDRLNSLMEPDGVLVLSEQHNGRDGTRIVKPHANFRIFLTMDPRFGELSRAMRNRSLEVYLPEVYEANADASLVQYSTSAEISRLRHLTSESREHGHHSVLEAAMDNLALDDMNLLEAPLCSDAVQERLTIRKFGNTQQKALVARFPALQLTSSDPQLVSMNEPRVILANCATEAVRFTRLWFLLRKLTDVTSTIDRAAGLAASFPLKDRTALLSTTSKTTSNLPDFTKISQLLGSLVMMTIESDAGEDCEAVTLRIASTFITLAQKLIKDGNTKSLDPLAFKAYVHFAQELIDSNGVRFPEVSATFQACVDALSMQLHQMETGFGLQKLWPVLRPDTASTTEQLDIQLAVEGLLDQFDQICRYLPQPRESLSAIRQNFARMLTLVVTGESSPDALSALRIAVETLSEQSKSGFQLSSAFGNFFRYMQQSITLHGVSSKRTDVGLLEMFSSGKTSTMILFQNGTQFGEALAQLQSADVKMLFNSGSQVVHLTRQLESFQAQPLGMLDFAKEELSVLVQAVCANTVVFRDQTGTIVDKIISVLFGILSTQQSALTPQTRNTLNKDFLSYCQRITDLSSSAVLLPGDAHMKFRQVYHEHLLPTMRLTQNRMVSPRDLSASLINLALAGLSLMVPDRLFDPAIYPRVAHDIHQTRVIELSDQIDGHKQFHQHLAGQDTTLVIRVLQTDLAELGQPPTLPSVVRPAKNELPKLQEIFSRIIAVVLSSEEDDSRRVLKPGSADWIEQWSAAQSLANIDSLVSRLELAHRAYDDFSKPILWFLKILRSGLAVAPVAKTMKQSNSHDIATSKHVPLLGSTPREVQQWQPGHLNSSSQRQLWLQHAGLKRSIMSQQPGIDDISDLLNVLDIFHGQWKGRLERDQADAVSKSQYYTYRGESERTDDDETRGVQSMFPTFEVADTSEDEGQPEALRTSLDARNLAIKVGKLHQAIFEAQDPQEALQDLIAEAMRHLAMNTRGVAAMTLTDLLSPILMQAKAKMEATIGERSEGINIYTDHEIKQSQVLFDLVHKIRTRFQTIREKWPEHATPAEVLSYTMEVLNLSLQDPVAKLLTKTEKLLEIVSQWQSIASREWSVSNLCEELTALIISWRRLELLSWSKLLDEEKRRHEEDAHAWYFVAYEAIVLNSRSIASEDNLVRYRLELVKTLEEFLRSTTMGQYSSRLCLLGTLNRTLFAAADQDLHLSKIASSVEETITHYRRYEPGVQYSLQQGRSDLQKAVKEQIKLASWKDTNVTALRDSARRSHYKLFKIVRKYRDLLNQVVVCTPPELPSVDSQAKLAEAVFQTPRLDTNQLEVATTRCAQQISGWNERPQRLSNPIGAVRTMQHVYSIMYTGIQINEELQSFTEALANDIQVLRKQTPAMLTENNSSDVRHLQERKRRLFADTLKAVAQMGIRRNLPSSELEKQSSTAVVLAGVDTANSSPTAVDHVFHDLLDAMPQVRQARTEHSDDLTDGEVNRSVGLLEGLLSTVVQQKAELSKQSPYLKSLERQLALFRSITTSTDSLLVSVIPQTQLSALQERIAWLVEIMVLGARVLQFQAEHATLDFSAELAMWSSYIDQARALQQEISNVPQVPSGASWTASRDLVETASTLFRNIFLCLQEWQRREPLVEHLTCKILPWVQDLPETDPKTNGVAPPIMLEQFDQNLRDTLDQVFVALQKFASTSPPMPENAEDRGWLLQAQKHIATAAGSLNVSQITKNLQHYVLDSLHLLSPEDVSAARDVLVVATPILEQYQSICQHLSSRQLAVYSKTVQMTVQLAKSFSILASQGFCRPADPSKGQDEQSGKLEAGTGLGEGEGAEDISKDVQDDEDLSELAQSGKREDGDDIENTDDAVDMGADDLEGEMGDQDKQTSDNEGEEQASGEDEDELNEEAGSVDDLDPDAVDEKMWDGMKNDSEEQDKEMKSDKPKGQKSEDQTAAEGDTDNMEDLEGGDAEEQVDEDANSDGGERAEGEQMDAHVDEEKALELPEELNLAGDEEMKDDLSDDGMDELSDIEQAQEDVEAQKAEGEDDGQLTEERPNQEEIADDDDESMDNGFAQVDEIMPDQPEDQENQPSEHDTREDQNMQDMEETAGGDAGAANEIQDLVDNEQEAQGMNQSARETNPEQSQSGKAPDNEEEGTTGKGTIERGAGQAERIDTQENQALKKLADVLEQFHQRREIMPATEAQDQQQQDDVDMADADLEHVNEQDEGTAHALGAAAADQTQNLDQSKAIEDDAAMNEDNTPPDVRQIEEQEDIAERFSRLKAQPKPTEARETGAILPDSRWNRRDLKNEDSISNNATEDSMSDVEDHEVHQQRAEYSALATSAASAAQLWHQCSTSTLQFSFVLTEQLRLILSPTTATRLRGDFRTGKRLNIKRIIPYIASNFKRDKIWMRRSVPSKRNYQIMIAVDDSKSMSESGADVLAFETLALLTRSLAMLEAGEVCVVGFGDSPQITIAHPFGQPFSPAESGPKVFQAFSFNQKGTNVRQLVQQSIQLFRDARLQKQGSGDDQWQLQLIVSDGHINSDHDAVARLVRQARDEDRIVIVFVIVDAGDESILDLKEAVYEREPMSSTSAVDGGKQAEMKLRMKRYLDSFPFPYYLVVRDVRDLPGVLATALKGWFGSVVDVQ